MFYKPRARLQVDTLSWDAKTSIVWEPAIISMKWTKNSHLAADELVVTVGWTDGGADPRMVKEMRCLMWMWDEFAEDFDQDKHLRFTGICKSAQRRLTPSGWTVEFLFHDYTCLFLAMKPFPTEGMPEWSDNFVEIWKKIRANTGYRDRGQGKIISSVDALSGMVFDPPEIADRTLGDMVPSRFHKISKPQPPQRCDAWKVWRWCCESLGLVTYIDKNVVVISTTNVLYEESKAAKLIYGENILEFDEKADTHVSNKGILGKSFDALKGVLLESAWPTPDDPAIKKSRVAAKHALKEGRLVDLNEASAEYEEFAFPWATTQEMLDQVTRSAYEEFSRQEIKGKIKTAEMALTGLDGSSIDILDLRAGDCIQIGVDKTAYDIARGEGPLVDRVQQLMDACGYIREVAELIVNTIVKKAFDDLIFHIEVLEVEYENGKFEVTCEYHNRVVLD